MDKFKLVNSTGVKSKKGRVVRQSDKQDMSFVYASVDETHHLFVIQEDNVNNGDKCSVTDIGVGLVFVRGSVRRGDQIRSRISGDASDLGACFSVQTGNSNYVLMGTALESGRNGLVRVALHQAYIS